MEIFKILEAIEIPHGVFATKALGGTEMYIATHDDFYEMLWNVGFIHSDHNTRKTKQNYIIRTLNREEIGDFKAIVSDYETISDEHGIVYESKARPIKEYCKQLKHR